MVKKKKKFKKAKKAKTTRKASKKKKIRTKKAPRKAQGKARGPKPIGRVTHWFGNISVAVIKLLAPFKAGDYIHIKGPHADFAQKIDSMQINHKFVDKARKGVEVGIKVKHKVREGYLVFKAQAPQVQPMAFRPILAQPLVKKEVPAAPPPPPPPPPPQKKGGYEGISFFKF